MTERRPSGSKRGLVAAGVHVPRYRLPADAAPGVGRAPGIASTAVPGADEDALTMAVSAADRALRAAPIDRADVATAVLATTTPPAAEGALAGRLATALGLAPAVATADFAVDLLAGAAALDRALDAAGPAVVAVADRPPGDPGGNALRLGAAAAAFVVADDAAVPVVDRAWHTDEYPGVRYRPPGGTLSALGVRQYERTAIRTGVSAAVDRLAAAVDGPIADDLAAATLHQPDARTPGRLGSALDLSDAVVERGVVADRVGDAGAAGVPLGLCAALAGLGTGDRTLAAFAGSEGGAAAFLLAGGLDAVGLDAVGDGVEVDHQTALRLRGELGDGTVAGGGAHVSLPDWRRTLAQRYRLEAGRCTACDTVAFPPAGACPACGERVAYEPVELARTGTVAAVTVIGEGGAPPEFAGLQRRGGPFATAIVECEAPGGGSARLPALLTDCEPDDVAVGDQVRASLRRLYAQEGVVRYGTKFVPMA